MERKYKNYLPTTCNVSGVCSDYLSEHDLLAYIDGNLSLSDTKKMERIIFEEGNEFYLDILTNLKERYNKHQGNIQAICQELDDEAAQIPFFREEYTYCEEPKLVKKEEKIQEQLDEMNRKIEAFPSILKKSIEEGIARAFIRIKGSS